MSTSSGTNAPMVIGPSARLAEGAFERYYRSLYRLLARRLPRPEDIDDVIQETFLRVLRLPDNKFLHNPQAYLYGIASKVAYDFKEKAANPTVTFDSEVVRDQGENPPHVEEDALGNWIGAQRQVEKALDRLSPTELRILLGECRDGLSHQQLAQELGLSVHTVKKYSVRALAFVRSGWDDYKARGPDSEGPEHAA